MPLHQRLQSAFSTIGADRFQIQGAGGNTSYKRDSAMWVKASGTELANAKLQQIFIPVDIAKVRAEIDGAGDGSCRSSVIGNHKLRSSIETTFHALFDAKVVLHTHSVATIVHAISDQGLDALNSKLHGLTWSCVLPYSRPGLPLTLVIRKKLCKEIEAVYVLANHGLIVTAGSIKAANQLLREAERRLHLPKKSVISKSVPNQKVTGWSWVPEASSLACDPRLRKLATGGCYVPDQAIFLGPRLVSCTSVTEAPQAASKRNSAVVIVKDQGVLIDDKAVPNALGMLGCLVDVLHRLPDDWQPNSLSANQVKELLGWDAEKYRQAWRRKKAR